MIRDRSGQLDDVNSQEEANSQNFIMGSDATEFVNRVNDEVRKRQKIMSNVAGEGEEHSIICGKCMAVTMNAATFMGKNFPDNQNSKMNEEDVRHISKIGKRTRRDLQSGYDSLGKTLMEISVIDW